MFLYITGAVQRTLREHCRDVRLHPQLQGVLRRERHQQAGAGVPQATKRDHLRLRQGDFAIISRFFGFLAKKVFFSSKIYFWN